MKPLQMVCVAFLYGLTGAAVAQAPSSTAPQPSSSSPSPPSESAVVSVHVENGIPIAQLIATVAKKSGKKFIVDPRVHFDIALVDKDLSGVSYSDFLTILQVYGFSAFETGGYVEVLPIANARQIGGTLISGNEKRPDAQIVTKVLSAKNLSVAQLVPILRPMIPQYGHLAALPCVNKLIMVDTYANVRRIESVIDALDVGEPFKPEGCNSRLPEHP
jgi:type II secretory pathway component GspD/PulD (secretin)